MRNLVSVIGGGELGNLITPGRFLLENTDFLAVYTGNQVSNWLFACVCDKGFRQRGGWMKGKLIRA